MDPRAALLILGNEGRDTKEVLKEFAEEIIQRRDEVANLERALRKSISRQVPRPYHKKQGRKAK
jgi:hypothetical protein